MYPFRGPFNSALRGLIGEETLLFPEDPWHSPPSWVPVLAWWPVCRIGFQVGLHSLCCSWAGQIAEIRKWLWSQHTCRMGAATVPTLSFSTAKCQARSETLTAFFPLCLRCACVCFYWQHPASFFLLGGAPRKRRKDKRNLEIWHIQGSNLQSWDQKMEQLSRFCSNC